MRNFQQEFQQEFGNFRQEFTNQQKAAIVSSMIIISRTAAGITEIEGRYIEQIAGILGIALDDPELGSIPQKGRANLVAILNTLSGSNKEWFAYAIYSLLAQKGQPEERKLQIALTILSDIGISEGDFVSTVEKSRAIYQKYMS